RELGLIDVEVGPTATQRHWRCERAGKCASRKLSCQIEAVLASVRRECRNVNERLHVGIPVRRFGYYRSAIGEPDEDNRAGNGLDDGGYRSVVAGDTA